jgi:3,4-dihydroxy 2-butanone 4-phosphate synthase/GTP cyclohydrolase II
MQSFSEQEQNLTRVLRAIQTIKERGMVIMVDEEDRENEGDIVFAAEHTTPELVNFMCREARGLICLALESKLIDKLQLPMMRDAGKSESARETAFTVSIEAKYGVTTGISAADRARTIQVAVDDKTVPSDLVVPGHIFPLRAKQGGVLERAGHTEGSIDLARLAGLKGAAVICEIMNEDGSMARMPDLQKLAAKFKLPIVSIPDLIQYRLMQESFVEIEEKKPLKTPIGVCEAVLFKSRIDGSRHMALVKGNDFADQIVDVRVHLQRPILDVFGGENFALPERIAAGLELLKTSNAAVFLYLSRERMDESMKADFELLAMDRPSTPSHTISMDNRQIGLGAQILRTLGIKKMRVHTTSPAGYIGLSGFGLEVVEHQALI